MNTYPEMNADIVNILSMAADPVCQYAAARIEELEDEREALKKACEAFAQWRTPTARDWDNGAIRDEFNALQQQARDALPQVKVGLA